LSPRGAIGPEMTRLIEGLGFEIVLVSAAAARRIEPSYAQCGKRDYPAGLSFCNCFALLMKSRRNATARCCISERVLPAMMCDRRYLWPELPR
jgi:uncharacterized protein with PIN domain